MACATRLIRTAIELHMNQHTDSLLSIRGLKVHFFMDEGVVKAVDGVSLDVYPGQIFGIVGESGCGKSVTMKAILRIVEPPGRIVGGKITTYRRLAEAAMARLGVLFPGLPPAWTGDQPLPGGDIPNADVGLYVEGLTRLYAWLPEQVLTGLVRRHGTQARAVVGDARRWEDMGAVFAAGLTEREVRYLAQHEWAKTSDDVLWRRTKAGLHLSPAAREAASASIEALL
jgi:ABC-type dipeptide/oligopeptide/nickel transport system ATPase component